MSVVSLPKNPTSMTHSVDRAKNAALNAILKAEKKAIAVFAISKNLPRLNEQESALAQTLSLHIKNTKNSNAVDATLQSQNGKNWMGTKSHQIWKTAWSATMARMQSKTA